MLRSNRLFQTLRVSKINGASSLTARRCFGASTGHGHGHAAHAPAGPYDVPHHPSQPDEAYPFGINPNAEYKYEGWEFVTMGTYLICFGILFIGSMTSDKNAFKVFNNATMHLYFRFVVVRVIYYWGWGWGEDEFALMHISTLIFR